MARTPAKLTVKGELDPVVGHWCAWCHRWWQVHGERNLYKVQGWWELRWSHRAFTSAATPSQPQRCGCACLHVSYCHRLLSPPMGTTADCSTIDNMVMMRSPGARLSPTRITQGTLSPLHSRYHVPDQTQADTTIKAGQCTHRPLMAKAGAMV
jgi:hypothetical protein